MKEEEKMKELSAAHPSEVREYMRRNEWRKPASGFANGFTQAN
ncbi:hypothetical protein [Parageobacillus thermoglucosidasius]|nr:hypothetical protein [Parageobacillus thermoglucosidasius]